MWSYFCIIIASDLSHTEFAAFILEIGRLYVCVLCLSESERVCWAFGGILCLFKWTLRARAHSILASIVTVLLWWLVKEWECFKALIRDVVARAAHKQQLLLLLALSSPPPPLSINDIPIFEWPYDWCSSFSVTTKSACTALTRYKTLSRVIWFVSVFIRPNI